MGKIDIPTTQVEAKVFEPTSAVTNITEADIESVNVLGNAFDIADNDAIRLIPYRTYFNLDVDDFSQDTDINFIIDKIKERGVELRDDIINEINKIKKKIGIGTIEGSWAKQVSLYLKIRGNYEQAKKAKEVMEGKHD